MIVRMITALLALFVLLGCEGSQSFSLRSSLLGEFARTTANVTEKGNRYTIRVDVHSTGLYNLLRGKRREQYRSEGTIRHGVYYARHFAIEKWANGKHTLAEYAFNYPRKTIMRRFRSWEMKTNKLTEDVRDKMPYFGHDDFMTVLHNALYKQPRTTGVRKTFILAGAENSRGRVPVYISNDPKTVQRWGGTAGGTIVQLGVHKGIFDGGKGSLTFVLDPGHSPRRIIIKKVKIVGTVTGKPIKS
jgi:hypothetical protein